MKKPQTKPFQLWHLRRDTPGNAGLLFLSLDAVHRYGQRVDISRYYRVYAARIERGTGLEEIFRMFNLHHPRDYLARSLSVSDLIVYRGGVWYVDTFGFRDVTEEVGGVPEKADA